MNSKLFDHLIEDDLLHNAISAPAAGIEFDYERLELLGESIVTSMSCHTQDSWLFQGDAFLKYLSSVFVFVAHPASSEGALHVARQKIISNRSLFRNANIMGLPEYIQAKTFTFKVWEPPNFNIVPPRRAPKPDEEQNREDAKDADVETASAKDDPAGAGQTEKLGSGAPDVAASTSEQPDSKADEPVHDDEPMEIDDDDIIEIPAPPRTNGINVVRKSPEVVFIKPEPESPKILERPLAIDSVEAGVANATASDEGPAGDAAEGMAPKAKDASANTVEALPTDTNKPKKMSKRERQKLERGLQTLGDKVSLAALPSHGRYLLTEYGIKLGSRRCSRSHHRSSVYLWRSRGSATRHEGAPCPCPSHRSVEGFQSQGPGPASACNGAS